MGNIKNFRIPKQNPPNLDLTDLKEEMDKCGKPAPVESSKLSREN